MPPSSSTSPGSQAASPSPGSASPASREVEDWSPAKWAYYEEVCHDILLPDWDDLTVGERRGWEGLWQREKAEREKDERERGAGRGKAKLVEEQGVRMGDNRQRGREEDREDREGGDDGEDGEEQDGSNEFDFEVNGVAKHATFTKNRNREGRGKDKDKETTIEPTADDIETSILGRGSRKAKLQGDSKRREQMLEETLYQSQSQITDDETEDEHLYPQPRRRRGKGNRQRERHKVEEYQPPRVPRRQDPAISIDPATELRRSRYPLSYENQRYGIQSDQGVFTAEVPMIRDGQAPVLSWNVAGSVPVPGLARVYVSPYPALPARAPTPAPGKGPVGVEKGGE